MRTFLSNITEDSFKEPKIYIGDFNNDVKVNGTNCDNNIQSVLKCTQLVTSVTTDYQTLLDHVYVSEDVPVAGCVVLESFFSDHKPVVLQLGNIL